MVTVYKGVTGSGKTYDSVKRVIEALRMGKNVVCDFQIDLSGLKGFKGKFFYAQTVDVPRLVEFAEHYHDCNVFKAQTLVVLDEVYNYFNPREYTNIDRLLWISFLKLHRHYGYDMLFICQDDKTDIDKAIRPLIDYCIVWRPLKRTYTVFKLLCLIFGDYFLGIEYYYKGGKCCDVLDRHLVHLQKKFARRYNTHSLIRGSSFERQLNKYLEYQREQRAKLERSQRSNRGKP